MAVHYRYSEWDGTQAIPDLEASEILDALSDDLMKFVGSTAQSDDITFVTIQRIAGLKEPA